MNLSRPSTDIQWVAAVGIAATLCCTIAMLCVTFAFFGDRLLPLIRALFE
jgi:hypothetical protein